VIRASGSSLEVNYTWFNTPVGSSSVPSGDQV